MTKHANKPPLKGLRILVGRARHQAAKLSGELEKLGAEVIEIPLIEIRPPKSYEPLDAALKQVSAYDWLILTSVNGVEALSRRLEQLNLKSSSLKHLRIAAIGPATARDIKKLGLEVNIVPKEYVAESVVESLKSKVRGKLVLLVRARVARDVIPRELRKLGAKVDVVEAYETGVPKTSRAELRRLLSDLQRRPHIATFTSSSMAKNFAALTSNPRSGTLRFASIGPVTSATLRELGLPVDIEARIYTIPGLVESIVQSVR